MLRLLYFFILAIFLSSCGIDVPELVESLRPPMGLKVVFTTNDTVRLEFWGFNDEDYFSGYVVFVSGNYNSIADVTTPISEKPKLLDFQTATLPTFTSLPTSEPNSYVFEINLSSVVVNDKGEKVFLRGFEYYVAVAAYSLSKRIYSPLSNITNVILTN
ncbi:MAG: hypothetical protein ACK4F9_05900 [Brevinematia bacterium]